jgi:uncharacterized BrkB/YihY/UPF0761 family membrane protein
MGHLLAQATSSDVGAGVGITILVLLIFALSIAVLVFQVLCIVDTTKYPDPAWEAAGQNKMTWLILTVVGLFVCFLISLYYWFAVRPKVRAAAGVA